MFLVANPSSALCCRETFCKFLTWADPEQKAAEFPVSCAQPTRKVVMQTNGTSGKRIL